MDLYSSIVTFLLILVSIAYIQEISFKPLCATEVIHRPYIGLNYDEIDAYHYDTNNDPEQDCYCECIDFD